MRNTRISLLVITAILISIGVVMVYSSSAIYAYERLGDSSFYLKRHLLYLLAGVLITVFLMSLDYLKIRRYTKPILLASLALLVLVLIPGLGREVGGARRWLGLWFFKFQPSEVVKIPMILYMADVLSRKQPNIKSFRHGFLPPMLVLGCGVVLILIEPDLGTAILIAAVVFIMFFVSGIRLAHLVGAIASSLPILFVLILSEPYRMKRIMAFLNPWADPKGTGFQIAQSFLALGRGGLFGVGLGQSRQKLFYLPAAHTDFVFSIIGEELGLIGTAAIAVLFILFIWQGAKIAFRSKDLFGALLSLGIISVIGLEAIINIGVVTGSLPTKGLPLPFISYGGSSLISNMVGIGLLLNVARDRY